MDSISMDGYVAVISPHLPPSILAPEALDRIRTVARQLPPCSLAGLELRLDGSTQRRFLRPSSVFEC